MTLIPTPFTRWGYSLFLIAVAGAMLGAAAFNWRFDAGVSWVAAALAAVLGGFGYAMWSMYMRADELTIVVRLVGTRTYDRRQVAAIEVGSHSGRRGRPVRFLGSDGSLVFITTYEWWGKDQLDALATYLKVPIERL